MIILRIAVKRLCCLLVFLSCAGATSASPLGLTAGPDGTVMRNGQPYRGVGANYYDLFLRALHNPTNTSSLQGLEKLAQAGIPFVRFAGGGYAAEEWKRYVDDKEQYLRCFDTVVRAAEKANIGLIPSMFWSQVLPDVVNEPRDQWGNPDSKTIALMRQYVSDMVLRYRESPALWAWEFGNEPNLPVDLPNAVQFRKKGGTERDDPKSTHLVVMLTEFAKEVRRHDPHRLIISGNSHPRATAWHNTRERSWKPDTLEQTLEILRRDNPAPLDTLGIHVYADAPVSKEMAAWASDHVHYLTVVRRLATEMKRPIFVGEFGLASKADDDPQPTRTKFEQLIAAMEKSGVDLAAFWVFDLKMQDKDWNVTFDNSRSYMLHLVAQANRRWNQAARTSPSIPNASIK